MRLRTALAAGGVVCGLLLWLRHRLRAARLNAESAIERAQRTF